MSAAITPTHQGCCMRITSTAAVAPVSATTEPTERSMCPAMITITMPIARIRMYEYCSTMLVRLPAERKAGFRIAKNATIATKATRMPLWRRFRVARVNRLVTPFMVLSSFRRS